MFAQTIDRRRDPRQRLIAQGRTRAARANEEEAAAVVEVARAHPNHGLEDHVAQEVQPETRPVVLRQGDASAILGVMALWPFSSDFYFADAYVFDAISRRYWLPGFIAHNVFAVLREIAILLPMSALAWFVRVRRTRSPQPR